MDSSLCRRNYGIPSTSEFSASPRRPSFSLSLVSSTMLLSPLRYSLSPGFFPVVLFDVCRVLFVLLLLSTIGMTPSVSTFRGHRMKLHACSIQERRGSMVARYTALKYGTLFSCLARVFTSAHCFHEKTGFFLRAKAIVEDCVKQDAICDV